MKNEPRKEVVTEVDISGTLQNPKGSTLRAIVKLIQNAFIKAILPDLTAALRRRDEGR